MPIHEKLADLQNDNAKLGLAGRAAGPVEAAGAVTDKPTALGEVHTSSTTVNKAQATAAGIAVETE